MARKIWSAAPGSPFTTKDARIIGPALEDIAARRGGRMTPRDVVQEATTPRHPLHDFFEWNDQEAGEQYRIQQARQMIAHVRVRVVDDKGGRKPFKAFFSVHDGENIGRVYVAIERVQAEAVLREQIIAQALAELQGWTARYNQYAQLGKLRVEIERLVHREERKRRSGRNGHGHKRATGQKTPRAIAARK